jgi:hypothetical protein
LRLAALPFPLLCALVAVAALATVGLSIWLARRLRPLPPEERERLRRLRVNTVGRITGGEIVDLWAEEDGAPGPPDVVYQYQVGGVTYHVSQALRLVPMKFDPSSWTPGSPVQVKYDPANPGNSILACEVWSGLVRNRS